VQFRTAENYKFNFDENKARHLNFRFWTLLEFGQLSNLNFVTSLANIQLILRHLYMTNSTVCVNEFYFIIQTFLSVQDDVSGVFFFVLSMMRVFLQIPAGVVSV